jgi:NitT/TauT family transport system substrate-binding protein
MAFGFVSVLAAAVSACGPGAAASGPRAADPAGSGTRGAASSAPAAAPASSGAPAAPAKFGQVRITVPAKSLTFMPLYLGEDAGIYQQEGMSLDLVQMRPPLGITAVEARDVAYSAAPGVGMRAAIQGVPVRAVMFMQTRPSFSLLGQPGVAPTQIKTVAVSGLGSTAHYAALNVMRKLGRGGPDDATYFATNETAKSYQALVGKAADAAIVTPPFTSMGTVAGYPRLGDAFDMQDVQGGLITTVRRIAERPAEVKAVVRATLRTLEYIGQHEAEVVEYLQREFELEPEVASGSYGILKQVFSLTGDMDEPDLRAVVEQMQ